VKRQHKVNSSELLLLKILPLSYHHSHFWAATLNFTPFFALAAPFLYNLASLAVFNVDMHVLGKALPQLLYGQYSTKRMVKRQICLSRDQSLSAVFAV